jgi:Zn-finger nucleic acid-binding protein
MAATANQPQPLQCPACRVDSLQPAEAEPLLPSRRCGRCGGQFIRGEQFYLWLEHPDRSSTPPVSADTDCNVIDTPQAKICPECGKIMRRYRVGHGIHFVIDRCGACAGIWLDDNEWELLKRQQLHDRVHFVFSSAWQAKLHREEQHRRASERLEARLGPTDFAELQHTISWLEQHPHREEMIAHLLDRLRHEADASHRPTSS